MKPHPSKTVASPQRWHEHSITMLEFGVVAVIFSVLAGVLLQRMAFYQDEAERTGVQVLVANMRSALYGKALEAEVQGRREQLLALHEANPIDFLQRRPDNYHGEVTGREANKLAPGYWYFEKDSRRLVYVFKGKKSFSEDSNERWYFKVKFSRLPTKNAKPDGAPDQSGGVALIQVD